MLSLNIMFSSYKTAWISSITTNQARIYADSLSPSPSLSSMKTNQVHAILPPASCCMARITKLMTRLQDILANAAFISELFITLIAVHFAGNATAQISMMHLLYLVKSSPSQDLIRNIFRYSKTLRQRTLGEIKTILSPTPTSNGLRAYLGQRTTFITIPAAIFLQSVC